jgi:hypothetical protein
MRGSPAMRNAGWLIAAFVIAVVCVFAPSVAVSMYIAEWFAASGPWGRQLYWVVHTSPFLLLAIAFGAICGRLLRVTRRWPWGVAIAAMPTAFFATTMQGARLRFWIVDALVIAMLAAIAFAISARRAPRSAPDLRDHPHRTH